MGNPFRSKKKKKAPPPVPEAVAAQAQAPGGALAGDTPSRRGQQARRRSRGRATLLLAGNLGQASIGRKTLTGQ